MSAMMAFEDPRSEDCLYLNVWMPSTEGALPVMVWTHSGDFAMGSGAQHVFSRHYLARRDVVNPTRPTRGRRLTATDDGL
jgi:para-nitrobenzyl esterase